MTTTDASKLISGSSRFKDKEKERKQRSRQKSQTSSERLKTVVRRLPPNLPEEVFWQSVQKWVSDETVTWKEYHQGKFRKRLNKENISSRAYIAFRNEEILASFSREYDGHLFRDKAGNESIAVVEFAPYQKVPTGKGKADNRMGTIETDEDYISFLESLKEPQAKPFDADTLEALVAGIQPPPPPTTTPLLEALKAEKSAQKDKEAILRNHAHYKDTGTANFKESSQSKKEDGKKKAPPAPKDAPSKSSESHANKKAAKKAAAAKAAGQGQGPAASGSGQSKDISSSQTVPPVTAPAKQKSAANTSKAPKGNRERQGSKGAASAPALAETGKAASLNSPVAAAVPAPAPATSDSAPVKAAATSSRRGRPVFGLGSRHFEAALTGAVGGKSRRERDKDKDAATPVDSPASVTESSTSPRNRPKQVPSIASAANPPTILQRDAQGGQATPAGVIARPSAGDTGGTPAAREEGSGRGGRGQRGRGRGRGGRGRGG